MHPKNTTLVTTLKQHNFSLTNARSLIFTALSEHGAVTMGELVSLCPNINRASVYRTIDLFETLAITHRVHIGWKYKIELSDNFDHHHHHAACTSCGVNIILDEDPTFEEAIRQLAVQNHFSVSSHQVELSGLCKNCDKNSGQF